MSLLQKLSMRAIGLGINCVSLVSVRKAGKMAFDLFATAPRASVRPKEQEFLNTAEVQHLQTGDIPFVQYTWGKADAPYVLCVYGWGYNAGRWRHFVPTIVEAGLRVIAFDPPGHGNAPGRTHHFKKNTDIITHILQSQGNPYALLTHSFGGSTSVYALNDLKPALQPQVMVVMAAFSHNTAIFTDYAKQLGLRDAVSQRLMDMATRILKRPLSEVDLAAYASNLGHINAMIVHDPTDPVTPFHHAERYAKHWPNAKLIKGSGGHHLGTQETTDTILNHILTHKQKAV